MVEAASQVIANMPPPASSGATAGAALPEGTLRAEVGDATELHLAHGGGGGSAAAVFSTFGLQQLGPAAPQVRTRFRSRFRSILFLELWGSVTGATGSSAEG